MNRTNHDAVPLPSAARARFPQDFWLNFELGGSLYRARRNNEALGFYGSALALRPDSSSAHDALAMNLVAAGNLEEAISQYKKAIEIDPISRWLT